MRLKCMWWSGFILILLISSIMTKNGEVEPRREDPCEWEIMGMCFTSEEFLALEAACTGMIPAAAMALPMVMNAMFPQPTIPLGAFPLNIGRREEETLQEPEVCLFDCTFRKSNREEIGNVKVIIGCDSEVEVEVKHRPFTVPVDYTCMDDCYEQPITQSFDPVRQSCEMNTRNSKFACHVYTQAKYDEDIENTKRFYVAVGRTSEIMSYCIEEQFDAGINLLNNEAPGNTVSEACSKLIDAPLENQRVGRSLNFDESYNNSFRNSTEELQRNSRKEDGKKLVQLEHGKERKRRQISEDVRQEFKFATTPWLCSLKFAGFRGQHRCGVVLLSLKPPVLVSSAHCNHICKDIGTFWNPGSGRVLEMCCCIDPVLNPEYSCIGKTSYCGTNKGNNARLVKADEKDFQIVCGEYSTEPAPQKSTPEEEAVLEIEEIIIHPDYILGEPLEGNDIAVYKISNPEELWEGVKQKRINPAAMPIDPSWYDQETPGRLYSWRDPEPAFRSRHREINDYISTNYLPRPIPMTYMGYCKDPYWMHSNTFYPAGTVCYQDLSEKGCVTFGNSGSPLMRTSTDHYGKKQFHWVGTLSMSKGCDKTELRMIRKQVYNIDVPVFETKAENPAVFTDGLCYVEWIVKQYNMMKPKGYKHKPWHCSYKGEMGDRNDEDQDWCMSSTGYPCDFTTFNNKKQCEPYAFEGFSYNVYFCNDTMGTRANCANNCKGVNANAIGTGGTPLPRATSTAGSSFLGFGGSSGLLQSDSCRPGQCPNKRANSRKRCCKKINARRGRNRGRRIVCPTNGC